MLDGVDPPPKSATTLRQGWRRPYARDGVDPTPEKAYCHTRMKRAALTFLMSHILAFFLAICSFPRSFSWVFSTPFLSFCLGCRKEGSPLFRGCQIERSPFFRGCQNGRSPFYLGCRKKVRRKEREKEREKENGRKVREKRKNAVKKREREYEGTWERKREIKPTWEKGRQLLRYEREHAPLRRRRGSTLRQKRRIVTLA